MTRTAGRRWSFDSPLRRRSRQVGRLGAAALMPSMYPSAPVARAFWFDGIANFGDALTPWLLRRAGVIPLQATAATADLVGVGSVLEMLPEDYTGVVWGSGSLQGAPIALPGATMVAVRGHLTHGLLGAPQDVVLGDPGILVSRFMKRPQPRFRVGIVPHHMHENDHLMLAASSSRDVILIDVRNGPTKVLRQIASCETILSSSLHGLITADSYGIPALWTRRAPDLWGGQFKFDDYESALTPGRTRLVDVDSVKDIETALGTASTVDYKLLEERQRGLLRALTSVELPRSSPLGALRRLR